MDYSQYPGYNGQYAYPPGYSGQYAQAQQYEATAPQIRNPFAPPPTTNGAANAQYDPDESAQIAAWHAAYATVDPQGHGKKGGKERLENANLAPLGQHNHSGGATAEAAAAGAAHPPTRDDPTKTVIRKGGGQTWEDKSLLEWDPTHFRIMVGNLAGEVTDESLAKAFAAYGVSKARVVRDKITTKSRGFGFVSFFDGEQGFKAAREMVHKYIGSHPVTIQRSKTDLRPVTKKSNDHHHHKHKRGRNNKHNTNTRDNKNKDENNNNKKQQTKKDDVLKANSGAGVEKKQTKAPSGLKVLG